MKNLDEATLEHIIEVITRQVLLLLEEEEKTETGSSVPISSRNFVEVVQPVVHAGADRIASTLGIAPADGSLPHLIDHTLLKPDATHDQIAQLCYEARKYGFASVCVNPTNVKLCTDLLKGSGVPVCTVVGFPLGATPTEVKAFETQQAIAGACHAGNAILKVIIEAALLTDEEKVIACQLSKVAQADFVKTSTGFGPGGATVEDVALMRRVVGQEMGVKAAGGIRTFEDAQRMIKAGASRIGASASVKIVQGPD